MVSAVFERGGGVRVGVYGHAELPVGIARGGEFRGVLGAEGLDEEGVGGRQADARQGLAQVVGRLGEVEVGQGARGGHGQRHGRRVARFERAREGCGDGAGLVAARVVGAEYDVAVDRSGGDERPGVDALGVGHARAGQVEHEGAGAVREHRFGRRGGRIEREVAGHGAGKGDFEAFYRAAQEVAAGRYLDAHGVAQVPEVERHGLVGVLVERGARGRGVHDVARAVVGAVLRGRQAVGHLRAADRCRHGVDGMIAVAARGHGRGERGRKVGRRVDAPVGVEPEGLGAEYVRRAVVRPERDAVVGRPAGGASVLVERRARGAACRGERHAVPLGGAGCRVGVGGRRAGRGEQQQKRCDGAECHMFGLLFA